MPIFQLVTKAELYYQKRKMVNKKEQGVTPHQKSKKVSHATLGIAWLTETKGSTKTIMDWIHHTHSHLEDTKSLQKTSDILRVVHV